MDAAIKHCSTGLGIWEWASSDHQGEPDVVIACAGDVPTLEALAATKLLRKWLPDLKVRFVNIVDLMTLQPPYLHPHGIPDREFDALFTIDKPVVFAFHGYPWLIHRLTYRRRNHPNIHVRGYVEEGTTTTPFDMTVLNKLDRFHLIEAVLEFTPGLAAHAAHTRQRIRDKLVEHREYVNTHGQDMPEIRDWQWSESAPSPQNHPDPSAGKKTSLGRE
jgi:xylulose-5-phosphate/fructose-6-phosphate phosphoketolase